jgi:4-hydroxybenzoate polyprenyltransferase
MVLPTLQTTVLSGRTGSIPRATWRDLLQALRPLHWTKNVFVLVPLVFSGRLFDPPSVVLSLAVFLLFSIASSSIYLVNDVCDREEDRKHPSKSLRPITRGIVRSGQALRWSAGLGGTACLSFLLSPAVGLVIGTYLAVNALYSVFLKRFVIMDVMIIGAGFVLRVLAGAYALSHTVSSWILICTFLLAALIGFCKRRYEILVDGSSIQFSRGYSPYFLDLLVLLTASSLISSYVYYLLSRGSWQNGIPLWISALVVFYAVIRYILVIHRSEENLDHTQLILSDRPLLVSTLLWTGLLITELYFYNPNIRYW